jgi:hypothetical protein
MVLDCPESYGEMIEEMEEVTGQALHHPCPELE